MGPVERIVRRQRAHSKVDIFNFDCDQISEFLQGGRSEFSNAHRKVS